MTSRVLWEAARLQCDTTKDPFFVQSLMLLNAPGHHGLLLQPDGGLHSMPNWTTWWSFCGEQSFS